MKRAAMAVLVAYSLSACAVQGPTRDYTHEQDALQECKILANARADELGPAATQAYYFSCMERAGLDPNTATPLPTTSDNTSANTGAAVAGGVLAGIAAVVLTAAVLAAGSTPCCYYPHHFHHWHHR